MCTNIALEAAHARALDRWARPFPGFMSGHDPRTSDQGLLTCLYGSLEHAARHEWLNAGRRLIDKTYIGMLWHVQDLTDLRGVRAEQVAAGLDTFIRDVVRPVWAELPHLPDGTSLEISTAWVEQMAGSCFGSVYSEAAASRLMFFLFPMLPIFNLSQGHRLALDEIGHPPDRQSYRAFAQAALSAYQAYLPRLVDHSRPAPSAADPRQRHLIQDLLEQTDWWTRRIFDHYLRSCLRCGTSDAPHLFGSDDAGHFGEA